MFCFGTKEDPNLTLSSLVAAGWAALSCTGGNCSPDYLVGLATSCLSLISCTAPLFSRYTQGITSLLDPWLTHSALDCNLKTQTMKSWCLQGKHTAIFVCFEQLLNVLCYPGGKYYHENTQLALHHCLEVLSRPVGQPLRNNSSIMDCVLAVISLVVWQGTCSCLSDLSPDTLQYCLLPTHFNCYMAR